MNSGCQYRYTFPKGLGGGDVVMRELSLSTYLAISEAGQKDLSRMVDNLVQAAIVEVRGVAVTPENRDEVWHKLTSKERELIRRAYRKIHTPDDSEESAFFDTEAVTAAA